MGRFLPLEQFVLGWVFVTPLMRFKDRTRDAGISAEEPRSMRRVILFILGLSIAFAASDVRAERRNKPRRIDRGSRVQTERPVSRIATEQPTSEATEQSEPSTSSPTAATPAENVIAPRIINGVDTDDFESVGVVGSTLISQPLCSGTLIGPRYVLTAGHCAYVIGGNTFGTFDINGETYVTSMIHIHFNYNDNTLANDIAILELNRDVQGVDPSPIYRNAPTVNQLLTLVGYGQGGTGTTGATGPFGQKRVGTTPIDIVMPLLIGWNFENNNESNTAPGDSGGPAFVLVNNQYYVAGITSYGLKQDASLGDTSYDTRVDAYASWIDDIIDDSSGGGGGSDPGACPMERAALQQVDSALDLFLGDCVPTTLTTLRQFRDLAMSQSAEGSELVKLYYQHGPQMSRIMAAHPDLTRQTLALVTEAFPAIKQAAATGEPLMLEASTFYKGLRLIDEYEPTADDELADALLAVKSYFLASHTIQDGRVSLDFSAINTLAQSERAQSDQEPGTLVKAGR